MAAPLYDALVQFAGSGPLRLHMPGHKGRMPGLLRDFSAIDFTELAPTGNLYTGEGPIAQAEALFAAAAGAREALFFSCGSTQGIFTMLSAAVGTEGTLILDRSCHQSAQHGMALLDVTPVYLHPPLDPATGLPEPVSPALLEETLSAHPEARAVLLTSPSYYGVITPLSELADLCHRHDTYLIVDQAHGAHFPFAGLPSAVQEGADLCVVSAHKTLPALGSSSILYIGAHAPWDRLQLKAMSRIFGTTSPSWPILASMDLARDYLERTGAYAPVPAMVRALRERVNRETPFRALTDAESLGLDPGRLTVDTAAGGVPGMEADRLLQQENIFAEMADERYLVAIVTCMDTPLDLDRLLAALKALPAGDPIPPEVLSPPEPVIRRSIREALFGPRETLPLAAAAGRIAAQTVAPYPPGVPVLAPGEEITEKHIAYLQKKRYNILEKISVAL